jgi:hypothetical protein
MSDDRDLATVLRRGMAAHAASAGDATALAERIIAGAVPAGSTALDLQPDRRTSRWQPWVLPLAAAAAVVLLVGSVVIGVRLLSGHGTPPAGQPLPGPVATRTATAPPTPAPSTAAPNTASPAPTQSHPSTAPVAAGYRVYDLTWIGPDTGWALGTAPCGAGRCAALAHTLDGGHTWSAMPALPAAMQHDIANCNAQCVSSLRFADARTGYAFGIATLYLTRDGGATWLAQQLPVGTHGGGTVQLLGLEIGNGTAVRLSTECRPGCNVSVERSAVGSSTWTTVALLNGQSAADAQLVRAGSTVVVRVSGNVAGGAGHATSTLFVSTDNGTNWHTTAEPCPQLSPSGSGSAEVDTRDVSLAPDGTIGVLCIPRQAGTGSVTAMTSSDGGRTFTALATSPGQGSADHLVVVSRGTVLVSLNGLQRTADNGSHWQRVLAPVSYLGFETPTVGRALTGDSTTDAGSTMVWTTTDGGASWTSYTFGS